jgi:predicted amidophosphoribosyltransferase
MNTRSVIELTDRFAAELVPPPRDAADVCPVCRSWRDIQGPICSNCAEHAEQLGAPCVQVLPISLYTRPSPLRDWLRFYKEGNDTQREEFGQLLAAIVERFFIEQTAALTNWLGGVDAVCIVPPTKNPPSALRTALTRLPTGHMPDVMDVLERGAGNISHRRGSTDAFYLADPTIAGRSLVLLDDVYTTGATAQSAAVALRSAGVAVKAIVAIGRRINPGYAEGVGALWERQRELDFRFADPPFWSD